MAYAMGEGFAQADLQLFNKNYERVAQQTESKFLKTPAVQHMDIKGISNLATIDSVELTEVTDEGSNPDKVYADMSIKNRKSVQRRFTKTYVYDSYDACVNLIKNPQSDLYQNLKDAFKRMTDRCVSDAAVAPVYIGKSTEVGTLVSAEDDGVLTLDGKTAFDYENIISPAITMYSNNYIDAEGVTLALSAVEEQSLRDDEKYMNSLYSNANTVGKGKIENASGFHVVKFAGTQNGVSEVELPILAENEGVRTNLFLAPNSIALAYELGRLDCSRSATKVNSWEVTIDVWIKTCRRQGARVIKALSTM